MPNLSRYVDECAGTHVSVGDVEQVFGAAALVELQLVTNGLFDDDVVGLLGCQNFIDILCRSHSVHLVGLRKNSKKLPIFCSTLFNLNITAPTFSVLLSRLMSE